MYIGQPAVYTQPENENPINGHRQQAAVITQIWSDQCVNLMVFFDNGSSVLKTSVTHLEFTGKYASQNGYFEIAGEASTPVQIGGDPKPVEDTPVEGVNQPVAGEETTDPTRPDEGEDHELQVEEYTETAQESVDAEEQVKSEEEAAAEDEEVDLDAQNEANDAEAVA